ncbi:MAG: cellobiose phosphorylase, partial [Oscillospiraceae bacterium]|nr:cellobiose phosphorylase [Oscillospiraceae bacterium]
MAKYYVAENKDFVVEEYNQAPAFSSFLPAVAGLRGKPLWTYYVNRGQCVSTFGVNNKDNAILEFCPANKAYRYTQREGFQTFLKIKTQEESFFYEPFKSQPPGVGITQKMYISSHDFRIEDVNAGLGVKTTVSYCTLPGERLAALVRKLTVENISGRDFEVEMLDGLPAILPFYIPDVYIKTQSNLRQAWMRAEHCETIPFYRLGVLPDDTAETSFVNGGNFYINFCFENGGAVLSRAVVDPALIFGCTTDFSYPENFAGCEFSIPDRQVDAGVTPCAFGWRKFALSRNAAKDIYSLIGYADGYEKVESFWNETLSEEYLTGKIEENRLIIKRLKQYNFTLSASGRFDSYCGQTMLDNILRGGCPIDLGGHSYYVYSRKHGDLEREYNFFQIDSTYYSQGNANFRDVNQNRRSDAAFFPFIKDTNVKTFFNLLQLDGFNPLVVKGSSFRVTDRPALDSLLEKSISPGQRKEARRFFERPFTPGSLMCFLDESEIRLIDSGPEDFLAGAMSLCEKIDEAEFSEGCWVDHWTYNTDLLEGFLSIFPDEAEGLLL